MLISQNPNQLRQKDKFNTKVLLFEDDRDFANAIKRSLTQHNYSVHVVRYGTQAWVDLENYVSEYELVIFDWTLPGIVGVELFKRLRENNNLPPVLMLTVRDRREYKIAGLDAGADDYLVKPFSMTELIVRVQSLLQRSKQMQTQQLTIGNLTLDYSSNELTSYDLLGKTKEIFLTQREFYLLEYLMKHSNKIITGEQIRTHLQKINSDSCCCVVATQMRVLREKLTKNGCANPIETLQGVGYRFNPNVEPK